MVISCSVPTCKNRFQKGGEIQFHSFPLRREDLCRRWAEAVGRQDWMPTKNSFVCSQHFTLDDYQIRAGKHKHFLRDGAVPSIFSAALPRRKGSWRQSYGTPRKLPFLLPSQLEISCSSPSLQNYPPPPPLKPSIPNLPTSLPSGVSIVPLKKAKPSETLPPNPVKWGESITFEYPQIKHEEFQMNGHKRMKLIEPYPTTNSMIITPKPIPKLNPIKSKPIEENDELDVTQFLSISLEKPPEDNENWRLKCQQLEKQIQKREFTIRQMNLQVRSLRKRMDSISIEKILKEKFNGLTYDILSCYINNTNLEPYEKRYEDSVKRFAMKLFDCSEEAYGMVREEFDLPHPGNVSHWLRASEDQDLDEVGLELSPELDGQNNGELGQESGLENGHFGQDGENGVHDQEESSIKIESYSSLKDEPILPKIEKYHMDELNITMEPVDACE